MRGASPIALTRIRAGADTVAADVRGENVVECEKTKGIGKARHPAEQKRKPCFFAFFRKSRLQNVTPFFQ